MERENDKKSPWSYVDVGTGTYAIAYSSQLQGGQFSTWFNWDSRDWDAMPVAFGGVNVIPWGANNDLPLKIRDLLETNNIGPGLLARKLGLLYGQGPLLYKTVMTDDGPERRWVEDKEIQSWLDSWDYRRYIRNALTQFIHTNSHFTKYVSGKARRIGKQWIARLECLEAKDCLLVWPTRHGELLKHVTLDDVRQVLVGDMVHQTDLRLFPVFDKWNPMEHEAAIYYHSLRSYGRNLYAVPSFLGSIPWMANANDIPEIVRALNSNLIAAAYIVHEPAQYWEQKQTDLQDDHPDWSNERINKELDKLRGELTKKLADVMAGKKNAGKFFTCIDFEGDRGEKQEWKIEPIDMNIDKYLTAQKTISKIADSSSTSGFGLSPALSNTIIDGKSDSGGQMLYALKIFIGADTQIPEEVALEGINDAIHINFPGKGDIRLGLWHKIVQKEDNVSAGERALNQV